MRRTRTLRYAALLAVLLLPLAAACGIRPTGITNLGTAPAALGASPAQSLDLSAGEAKYQVYFYQGSRLVPVQRFIKGEVTETTVLTALIGGPSKPEQAAGYFSAVPTDLVAKPQANDQLGAYNLSEPLGQRAKAQFICTMQYFDVSTSIGIQIGAGRPLWNDCQDTTNQYIPMPGAGSSLPVPSTSN